MNEDFYSCSDGTNMSLEELIFSIKTRREIFFPDRNNWSFDAWICDKESLLNRDEHHKAKKLFDEIVKP